MRFLRILSLLLLFVFFASLLVHPLYSVNQDIGRHIKSGEIIWQTKNVYKTNLFSFTEPDHPFINHHWLSEVVFFGLNNLAGLQGLIIFKTLILLLALGLVYRAVKNNSEYWAFLVSAMAGILVWTERTDVRPEIFSYLFLAFFIFAIYRAKYASKTKYLYFLPLVQIFWTNMHIYFVFGPILILFFLLDRKFRYWKIFLAVSAATLINPHFLAGAIYPLKILSNYGYSIVENQNIFFLLDYGISTRKIQLFQTSVVILIVGFIIRRRPAVFELLSGIFFSVMAVKMLRNFGPFGLILIPLTAVNFSGLKISAKKEMVLLITASALMAWASVYNIVNRVSLAIPIGAEKAVAFVKENNIQGPVFNNFDVGSYLIWKLYPAPNCSADRQSASSADGGRVWCGTSPDFRVFVDGRPEAYSKKFFEEVYKPMQEDPQLWKKYSDLYGINYVFFYHRDITPWARTFLGQMAQNTAWPMVYVDDFVVVFQRGTTR